MIAPNNSAGGVTPRNMHTYPHRRRQKTGIDCIDDRQQLLLYYASKGKNSIILFRSLRTHLPGWRDPPSPGKDGDASMGKMAVVAGAVVGPVVAVEVASPTVAAVAAGVLAPVAAV